MRILVAMSGGVDSSTVAGLLHEAGHDVIGITLQLYDHGTATGRPGSCCAGQDIHDARRVADHLGIPHYVVDAEARFAEAVIRPFADSYAEGETPVPCTQCNQSVKFPELVALAQGLNAERLATGHYVRRIDGPGGPELHRAHDAARDQSWFLYATTPAQLALALFPLGGMDGKDAVRREAARLGIPVAAKPDSQDICFVPSGRYADLVSRLRPDAAEQGEIVGSDGRVLGLHDGIGRYTVGQGKRLGALPEIGGARPVVVALDPTRRRVIVGPRGSGSRDIRLRAVNWLMAEPTSPFPCAVKLRAREAPQPALLRPGPDGLRVELEHPALAAPGQACVFYQGSRILGGGTIDRAQPAAPVDARPPAALSPRPLQTGGGVAQR